jgi:hypothetical protein
VQLVQVDDALAPATVE